MPLYPPTGEVVDGSITTAKLADDVVTNAKLANMPSQTIKGRATAGVGDPEDLLAAPVRAILKESDSSKSNLVFNGGFEDGTTGFTLAGTVTILSDAAGVSGAKYLSLGPVSSVLDDEFITVVEGEPLIASVYVKGNVASANHARIQVFFYDHANLYLGSGNDATSTHPFGTTWSKISNLFIVPVGARVARIRCLHLTGSAASSLFIDELSLVRQPDLSGGVLHLAMSADITTSRIEETISYIPTADRAVLGDAGGAMWRRVSVNPGHPGVRQSVDGAFWEIDEPVVGNEMLNSPDEAALAAFKMGVPLRTAKQAILTINPVADAIAAGDPTDVGRHAIIAAAVAWQQTCITTGGGDVDLFIAGTGEIGVFGQITTNGPTVFSTPPNLRLSMGTHVDRTISSFTIGAMTGKVVLVDVTNGGANYATAPTVSFTGGTGTGATALALVAAGKVVAVVVTNGGSGWSTVVPTVVFTGGGGTGAAATARTNPNVVPIVVTLSAAPPANAVIGMPVGAWNVDGTNDCGAINGAHELTNVVGNTVSFNIRFPRTAGTFTAGVISSGTMRFPVCWLAVSGGYIGTAPGAEGYFNSNEHTFSRHSFIAARWRDGEAQTRKGAQSFFHSLEGNHLNYQGGIVAGFPNQAYRMFRGNSYLSNLCAGGGIVALDLLQYQTGGSHNILGCSLGSSSNLVSVGIGCAVVIGNDSNLGACFDALECVGGRLSTPGTTVHCAQQGVEAGYGSLVGIGSTGTHFKRCSTTLTWYGGALIHGTPQTDTFLTAAVNNNFPQNTVAYGGAYVQDSAADVDYRGKDFIGQAFSGTSFNGLEITSGANTFTLEKDAASVARAGAHPLMMRTTGPSDVTFPLSGTLATLDDIPIMFKTDVLLSVPSEYPTVQDALDYLSDKRIASNATVKIEVTGHVTTDGPAIGVLDHVDGQRIQITGVSAPMTKNIIDTNSVTGTAGAYGVTMQLADVNGVTVGDVISLGYGSTDNPAYDLKWGYYGSERVGQMQGLGTTIHFKIATNYDPDNVKTHGLGVGTKMFNGFKPMLMKANGEVRESISVSADDTTNNVVVKTPFTFHTGMIAADETKSGYVYWYWVPQHPTATCSSPGGLSNVAITCTIDMENIVSAGDLFFTEDGGCARVTNVNGTLVIVTRSAPIAAGSKFGIYAVHEQHRGAFPITAVSTVNKTVTYTTRHQGNHLVCGPRVTQVKGGTAKIFTNVLKCTSGHGLIVNQDWGVVNNLAFVGPGASDPLPLEPGTAGSIGFSWQGAQSLLIDPEGEPQPPEINNGLPVEPQITNSVSVYSTARLTAEPDVAITEFGVGISCYHGTFKGESIVVGNARGVAAVWNYQGRMWLRYATIQGSATGWGLFHAVGSSTYGSDAYFIGNKTSGMSALAGGFSGDQSRTYGNGLSGRHRFTGSSYHDVECWNICNDGDGAIYGYGSGGRLTFNSYLGNTGLGLNVSLCQFQMNDSIAAANGLGGFRFEGVDADMVKCGARNNGPSTAALDAFGMRAIIASRVNCKFGFFEWNEGDGIRSESKSYVEALENKSLENGGLDYNVINYGSTIDASSPLVTGSNYSQTRNVLTGGRMIVDTSIGSPAEILLIKKGGVTLEIPALTGGETVAGTFPVPEAAEGDEVSMLRTNLENLAVHVSAFCLTAGEVTWLAQNMKPTDSPASSTNYGFIVKRVS